MNGEVFKLKREARVFVGWTFEAAPIEVGMEVSFEKNGPWHLMSRTATSAKILVAHPLAINNPVDTVVVAYGRNAVDMRFVANPEVIVEDAGFIDVE